MSGSSSNGAYDDKGCRADSRFLRMVPHPGDLDFPAAEERGMPTVQATHQGGVVPVMNRREINRIARERAAEMIFSSLNYGWEPDDLMAEVSEEDFKKIKDQVFWIAVSVRDAGKRQS